MRTLVVAGGIYVMGRKKELQGKEKGATVGCFCARAGRGPGNALDKEGCLVGRA